MGLRRVATAVSNAGGWQMLRLRGGGDIFMFPCLHETQHCRRLARLGRLHKAPVRRARNGSDAAD